eukprot:CAMPEP_0195513174 /NCGR_PEP_ID=MMETSP0794_2-20130614/4886_1 /TAXON_ID=515487 /ORGANISM="Stephanopyxis turris, Strain CCMP 815" /LENGTH=454 /DNA_ID=CAMNT_0040641113 /DNA_START=188 /DNA_END=1553 /DNA_ORIENTATION=+
MVCGTACSILSKLMMELKGVGMTGEIEVFEKPIFQSFGMFIGMTFGVVMHCLVLYFKIPFPGYPFKWNDNDNNEAKKPFTNGDDIKGNYGATDFESLVGVKEQLQEEESSEMMDIPVWMYFFLAIPAVFDLAATTLCMCGLTYLDVSIYQMLRGSGIIFVALMKQHVLGHVQTKFQWVGVGWNVMSVVLVGITAMLSSSESNEDDQGNNAILGVSLVMLGAFVQALQFVFEEKVMTMDIPAPPLLLIGMEGVWGAIICLLVVYPAAYYLPGDDHGSYESFFYTMAMIQKNTGIQMAFYVYFFAIFFYNLFAVLVTFMLSSVWHAILDNFRPITIWGADMLIFYSFTAGAFGEAWTKWSFIQLIGMCVLLYGTAIYNAPNPGSLKLKGQWWAFGIDLTNEYQQLESEAEQAKMDAKWETLQAKAKERKGSFMGEKEPRESIHSQFLRGGFGSPKI